MHTLKPRPATPRGWSGGSTAIYFFAGGGRFGASADIGANRSERKKTQDDKCCASHISTKRAESVHSLRMHGLGETPQKLPFIERSNLRMLRPV
jgi:hypothetical protein